MWQVLLAAAAAAGSGILAKKLINPTDTENPVSDFNKNGQECDQNVSLQTQDPIFPYEEAFQEDNFSETENNYGRIFKFSSTETRSKDFTKKMGSGFKSLEKNAGGKKVKKCWPVEGGEKGLVGEQRGNGRGKRISVCLKKRRTGKHAAGRCESCVSKDNSFGLGVGVGIMYMMSAGKVEINKLNCAMDETAKTVQELKAEISRRASSRNSIEAQRNNKHMERIYDAPSFPKPGTKSKDSIKSCCLSWTEEGEYTSSVLTEDRQLEVLEIDQLEVELESELQKLPWCAIESSDTEARTGFLQDEFLSNEVHQEDCYKFNSFQHNGVSPSELDKKLCNLLIERQGSQIKEYEAELHQAHSKLHEKEAELQALKDCVKRLTEFSLASASDGDSDVNEEDEKQGHGDEEIMGLNTRKSVVGTKRAMGFNSYTCSTR
ncbi:uncharacterized protein [Primulina eburnea]|uniref:uncharacterized protein n=1 Tax=Primulina eburnea TaxID=1245227 RepID=UPI003C6CBE0C